MKAFDDTLDQIVEAPGVKGAAVVMSDGMLVAEKLDDRFRDDVVAALTSFLITTTSRCLQEGGMAPMNRFLLHCTHGKVQLVDLGQSWLVVILDQFADPENARRQIDDGAERIREQSQIG